MSKTKTKINAEFGKAPATWYMRNGARLLAKEARLLARSRPRGLNRPILVMFEPRS